LVFEIRDALYGDIVLSTEEARLLNTFEMQRLRHIKQLGNVSLVYPSANHTRFEHSLGTRWMTQKIVRISDLPISRSDRELLYKCALIHDIAEPAYAHATERLSTQGFPTHEEIIQYVLDGTYKSRVLERKDVENRFICDIITSEEERHQIQSILTNDLEETNKPLLRELIRGYIDGDNLDYLRRDSFFLGLSYGNYDDRIFASFRIAKYEGEEHIAFRDSQDTLNSILSILDARFVSRRAAYVHHAVIIADDMLLEALKLALAEDAIDMFDIFILADYELLYKMRNSADARPVVDRLLYRNLSKRAYVLGSDTSSEIKSKVRNFITDVPNCADFKQQISEKSEIPSDRIFIHFPLPSGWKDFHRILLVSDDGGTVTLGQKMPSNVSLLREKYDSLWRFMISTYEVSKDARDRLYDACSRIFGFDGIFRPKKTPEEIRKMKDDFIPLLEKLRAEEPSSMIALKVLLDKDKPLSRYDIAKELNIKPPTVSHYLTLINRKLSNDFGKLLTMKRVGRVKLWTIDRRLKEVLRNGLS